MNTFNEGNELAEAKQLVEGVEVPFATYSYDELGERVKTSPAVGTATTYGYDQAGDLNSVERTLHAISDSYTYDGNGLRASQTISGTTSYMGWDVSGSLPLLVNDGTNATSMAQEACRSSRSQAAVPSRTSTMTSRGRRGF